MEAARIEIANKDEESDALRKELEAARKELDSARKELDEWTRRFTHPTYDEQVRDQIVQLLRFSPMTRNGYRLCLAAEASSPFWMVYLPSANRYKPLQADRETVIGSVTKAVEKDTRLVIVDDVVQFGAPTP